MKCHIRRTSVKTYLMNGRVFVSNREVIDNISVGGKEMARVRGYCTGYRIKRLKKRRMRRITEEMRSG